MIILSALGTGGKETTYSWGEHPHVTTRFFADALATWFPEAEVLLLVTQKARESNGEFALERIPRANLINIPDGSSEADYWQIFNVIEQHIPNSTELLLDITHGFRSLPMIGFLAVAYLRSAKAIQLQHLVYGALEAQKDEITPVIDLTSFVTMLDWANATNRFLETGDARKFKSLVSIRSASTMNNVGNELEKLSNELALHRTIDAMDTAKRVLEKISQSTNETAKLEHSPFKLLRDRIVDTVLPIAGTGRNPEIYSQFAQIIWYANQKQYAQGISLAREWLVAVRIWKTDGWFSVSREEQEVAEKWLNTMSKALKDKPQIIPPNWLETVKIWEKIAEQRNDYAHFGMRKSTISARETLKNAQALLNELRTAVTPLGLELPEVSP